MKKIKVLAIVLCLLLSMLSLPVNAETNDNTQTGVITVNSNDLSITINDEEVKFDDAVPFVDDAGRLQVPVRFISEYLGYEVEWEMSYDVPNGAVAIRPGYISMQFNGEKVYRTIFIFMGDPVISISDADAPDDQTRRVRNGRVTMDTTAVIKNDRVYVPLRYVAALFGYEVDWK